MTILHLIRSYGKPIQGGAEINIDNLVGFIYQSQKIKSIVLSDNGIWFFDKHSKRLEKDENFSKKKFVFKLISRKFKTPKIIHVHSNGYIIFIGYLISLVIGAKLLVKITRIADDSLISRNRFFSKNIRLTIKRILLKLICLSNFVNLHCLTQSAKHEVSNFTKNIVIFPNLTKSRAKKIIIKKEKTILITSRMIRRKNIDLTLDQIINQNIHQEYKVIIIGDGPELKRLKIKYKEFRNIIFKGLITSKNISYYYQKCEFFINLSSSEGMSNALIEAMVNGCKSIVTDIPENRDTASDYAIYHKKKDNLKRMLKLASKLSTEKISNFASKKYTPNILNSILIKELYDID